jgi:hypothetical protein
MNTFSTMSAFGRTNSNPSVISYTKRCTIDFSGGTNYIDLSNALSYSRTAAGVNNTTALGNTTFALVKYNGTNLKSTDYASSNFTMYLKYATKLSRIPLFNTRFPSKIIIDKTSVSTGSTVTVKLYSLLLAGTPVPYVISGDVVLTGGNLTGYYTAPYQSITYTITSGTSASISITGGNTVNFTIVTPVSAIPAPTAFSSNTLTVTGQTGTNTYKNGTYIAAASSYDGSSDVWKCLNNSTTDYWHSDYMNSGQNYYTSNPYDSATPVASYIGGGSAYYYNTIIDGVSYAGEWIQIQLPYQFLITSYSLTTRPTFTWAQRGFKKFYIAGSNNGFTWYMVNTQDLDNTTAPTSNTQSFSVSTTNRFSYYRMVINQIYNTITTQGMVANLGKWNIYGQYDAVLPITFNATVSNNVYSLQQITPTIENIQVQPFIPFEQGKTYIINYPTAHPLALSETKNGTWASGTPYTTGITNDTTNGKLTLAMSEYKTLYYYGTTASGMGYNPSTDFSANNVNTSFTVSSNSNNTYMCCSKDAKIVWLYCFYNNKLLMSINYGYTFREIIYTGTGENLTTKNYYQMCCDDTGFKLYVTQANSYTYKFNATNYTMDQFANVRVVTSMAITGDGNILYGLTERGDTLKKYTVSTNTETTYSTNFTMVSGPQSFTMDNTGTYLAACGAVFSSNTSKLIISKNGGATWSSPVISSNASDTGSNFGCAKYNYTGTVLCVSYYGTGTTGVFISYDQGSTFTNLNTLNVFSNFSTNGRSGGPAIHIDASGTNFLFMDQNTITQYNKTTNTTTSLNSVLGNTGNKGGLVCGDIYGTRFVFSYPDSANTTIYVKSMERPNIYNPNRNFNSIASTAKFYYSGDYGVVKSSANNNVITWKNRIAGGVDASANTIDTGSNYPQYVSTLNGVNFNSNMIKIYNGTGNQIGFNSLGGAKLATEPAEQTFFFFGYHYAPQGGNAQMLSKPGGYVFSNSYTDYKAATLHSMFNTTGFILNLVGFYDANRENIGMYTSPANSATPTNIGFFIHCFTTTKDLSVTEPVLRTIVNNHAYPNIDTSYNNVSIQNIIRETDFHDFELGFYRATGEQRSFRGTLGEIMYFNRKLTDNERFILEGKIAWKYGQAVILPASHPYKTVAPA